MTVTRKKKQVLNDIGNNLGEEVRDILTSLEADEKIGNLEEGKVHIIEEIAEALERRQKNKLPALRNLPKKKLLKETVKIDKVVRKFKKLSITKTN